MEIRQLRYFVAVAEELHFGRAAARLHISQPPLTVHIKRLEQLVGAALFDRTSRQVQLTEAGNLLYPRALAILEDVEQASAEVGLVAAGHLGQVRLGFVSSASYEVVPLALREMRERHPGIRIDLEPLVTGDQLEALMQGRLDLGVVRDAPLHPGLDFTTLREERIVAVVPADHHLATSPVVEPADLAGEPLILFPFTSMPGFVAKALEVFREHGSSPQVVQQVINQENVMGLVAAGVGISLLPESFSSVHHPRVITRGLTTAPTSMLQLAHVPAGLSPAATVLRDLLRAQRPTDSRESA
ncbi:MAG: LysR substrate-binding domain-containing protein [Micrococcaceae bacterium]